MSVVTAESVVVFVCAATRMPILTAIEELYLKASPGLSIEQGGLR